MFTHPDTGRSATTASRNIEETMKNNILKEALRLLCEPFRAAESEARALRKRLKAARIHSMSRERLMECAARQYRRKTGCTLDWNDLNTYNEKMQWAKLFDNDPRKTLCADKYAVREWVKERIGEEHLIPLLGRWTKVSDIDFDALPESFVLKTNHASRDAVIVRRKTLLTLADRLEIRRKLRYALRTDYGVRSFEMHYGGIEPCIIAEQLLVPADGGDDDLRDYKFICFDGKVHFCWVDLGRNGDHRRNIYDTRWQLQPWTRDCRNADGEVACPENFDRMLDIAARLAEGFSHVRVDLYNVDGRIYFGEMTFTSGAGFPKVEPESANLMLGRLWNLKTE